MSNPASASLSRGEAARGTGGHEQSGTGRCSNVDLQDAGNSHFDFAADVENLSQASRPGTRGFRARWKARSNRTPSEPQHIDEHGDDVSQFESQSLASWDEIEPEPKFKRSKPADESCKLYLFSYV